MKMYIVNSELNHNLNKNVIVDIILPDYILMCGLEFGEVLTNRLSIMECKLKCLHCNTVSKYTSSPCCWESKSIVNNYHVHMTVYK